MTSSFEHLLRDIVEDELGEAPTAETLEQFDKILSENDLDDESNVPEWLSQFFMALRDRRPLDVNELPESHTEGDVGNFFCDLQDVDALDCYDYGEWIRIRLPNHGLLGFVSVQHSYYTVALIQDVPDDGLSDLSAAKKLSRPRHDAVGSSDDLRNRPI